MTANNVSLGEVLIYQTEDGRTALDVRLEQDTVWLRQEQMGQLFGRERSVITKHLRNVFAEGELDEKSNVQNLHIAGSDKPVKFYSLDVIISVGYRVKSQRGTQFRIWATDTLKQHLIQGYTLNERRLREKGLTEMEQAVQLLARTLHSQALVNDTGKVVLNIILNYAKSWRLLLQYDENQIQLPAHRHPSHTVLDLAEVRVAIAALKKKLIAAGEATEIFGRERGDQLAGILGAIEQSFDGQALYASLEEKAAHLLYFIIKDHPFTDGNKRIGSLLFIVYLRENNCLDDRQGRPKINDNALVALALLVAESNPANKELMIRLIINLLTEGTA